MSMFDPAHENEATEEKADALDEMVAEDTPGGDKELDPADKQRQTSWEGRLRKREQELAAREAALAEAEQAKSGAPVQALADGGEVIDDGDTAVLDAPVELDKAAMETPAEAPPEAPPVAPPEEMPDEAPEPAEGGEGGEDGGEDVVNSIQQEASALAGDPARLAATLRQMEEDYGRDFVVAMVAANGPMINAIASPYAQEVEGRIDSLIDELKEANANQHFEAIREAHEDFEDIADSEEFGAWRAGLEAEEQARVDSVVEKGSARQIIAVLNEYKKAKEPKPAQTMEDAWAEDAATSIKSSAPVKIPARAPASEEDEYKMAWNA